MSNRRRPLPWFLPLIALLARSVSGALYSAEDAVLELNTSNFDRLVLRSDGVALVHFGAPWSGHCKLVATKLAPAANHLKGLALVGFVDCSVKETAGDLCQRYEVKGFPTIKLFGSDHTKNPATGEVTKEALGSEAWLKPTAAPSAKTFVEAVTGLLTDLHITRLATGADLKALAEKAAGKPQVLLFTDKEAPATLYKSLSTQLRRGLAFGQVHSSAEELVKEFGVEQFPTLVVVKGDASSRETYTGELKAPPLLDYLRALSPELLDQATAGEASGSAAGGKADAGKAAAAWSFVKQVDGLAEVSAADAREDMALVALHGAEGEEGCADTREAFLAAAGEMQAVADTLLVSVPATELAEGSEGADLLTRLGADVAALREEPCELQVLLLPFGEDKSFLDDYRKYRGPPEGKALQRWVTDQVPTAFVPPRLDDESGPVLLTADPSAGKIPMTPKVLLFTNKDEAPGVFRALALALRGRGNMAFAWVQVGDRASRVTVDTFKPPKVPGLVIVMPSPTPEDDPEGPGRMRFGMQPYIGPLRFGPMKSFLEDIAKQVEMAAGVSSDQELIRQTMPHVTTQAQFESNCTAAGGMCLLALLDSSAPGFEEGHKELLALALQQSRANAALHFAWLDARKHKRVMQAFGVLSSDLPTLVALSSRRMRFAVLPAAAADGGSRSSRLRPEAVVSFINDVLSGKLRTQPLQALPEVREGDEEGGSGSPASDPAGRSGAAETEAADAAVVEDEFDLSDILAEEVEGSAAAAGKADRLREVEEQLKAEEEARKAAESAAKGGSKKKSKKSKKKKGKKAASEEL